MVRYIRLHPGHIGLQLLGGVDEAWMLDDGEIGQIGHVGQGTRAPLPHSFGAHGGKGSPLRPEGALPEQAGGFWSSEWLGVCCEPGALGPCCEAAAAGAQVSAQRDAWMVKRRENRRSGGASERLHDQHCGGRAAVVRLLELGRPPCVSGRAPRAVAGWIALLPGQHCL